MPTNMLKTIAQALIKPQYALLAVVVFWIVISISLLFPNRGLLLQIVSNDTLATLDKLQFVGAFYGAIGTNFTVFSAIYTITIAVLFAINTVLLVYYIKRQKTMFKNMPPMFGTGIGGLTAGFLGIGCATCGTFVLTTILSIVGAGALLTLLPLGGQEFGLLGIGLLTYSIYAIAKKMNAPMVCKSET